MKGNGTKQGLRPDDFVIEEGVDTPLEYNRYPWGKLICGQSFFAPVNPHQLRATAERYGKGHGMTFRVRAWKSSDDKGNPILGARCWRTK